jgi:hypothetical protein
MLKQEKSVIMCKKCKKKIVKTHMKNVECHKTKFINVGKFVGNTQSSPLKLKKDDMDVVFFFDGNDVKTVSNAVYVELPHHPHNGQNYRLGVALKHPNSPQQLRVHIVLKGVTIQVGEIIASYESSVQDTSNYDVFVPFCVGKRVSWMNSVPVVL